MPRKENLLNRRNFIATAGATALATGLSSSSAKAEEPIATRQLKVGIVGMGGRGTGAVMDTLGADPNTILWAIGDIDQRPNFNIKQQQVAEKFGAERVQVTERVFIGFDSCQKVIDSGVDIILLCSAPGYRPDHIARAMKAGVHVFAEKPWCVDAHGLQVVRESVEAGTKKGISFMTGLVWRYTNHSKELYGKLLSGDYGKILNATGYYVVSQPTHPLNVERYKTLQDFSMQGQWQQFREMGGDWIHEQFIHSIDKLSWVMEDTLPERCYGNGGTHAKRTINNVWEQFNVTYEYPEGKRAYLTGSRGGKFSSIHDEIFTEKASAKLSGQSYIQTHADGKKEMIKPAGLGYRQEHVELYKAIRAGKTFSDLETATNAHVMSLMGRLACYSGQEIYPEDVLESDEILFDSQKPYAFGDPFTPGPHWTPKTYVL